MSIHRREIWIFPAKGVGDRPEVFGIEIANSLPVEGEEDFESAPDVERIMLYGADGALADITGDLLGLLMQPADHQLKNN